MKTIYCLLKEILFWALTLVNEAPCRVCLRPLAFTASENFVHANRHICRDCLSYLCQPETGRLVLEPESCTETCTDSGTSSFAYIALAPYEDLAKDLIALVKQKAEHRLLCDLAFPLYCLLDKITSDGPATRGLTAPNRQSYLLIPIPMHKSKLQKQKQNHAKLIAGHLEHYARTQGVFKRKSLRLQLVEEVLVQIRETKPQKYLNKQERRLNVQNAFALGKDAAKIKDKDVILIDDVLTSGATMYEALKEIRKAQPRSILICTLARTIFANHAKESRRVET